MDFQTLFYKISPRLKKIANSYSRYSATADADDLYQEMCVHLWNNFKDGVPTDINDAYIIQGCRFHTLNYLRKQRQRVILVSLQVPINEGGDTLADLLPEQKVPIKEAIDIKLTIDEIKDNGFCKKQKDVFLLLSKGYTAREAGHRLGISHVMVLKLKKSIIRKYQNKDKYHNTEVTK